MCAVVGTVAGLGYGLLMRRLPEEEISKGKLPEEGLPKGELPKEGLPREGKEAVVVEKTAEVSAS
jgi:hypothetical protein